VEYSFTIGALFRSALVKLVLEKVISACGREVSAQMAQQWKIMWIEMHVKSGNRCHALQVAGVEVSFRNVLVGLTEKNVCCVFLSLSRRLLWRRVNRIKI